MALEICKQIKFCYDDSHIKDPFYRYKILRYNMKNPANLRINTIVIQFFGIKEQHDST